MVTTQIATGITATTPDIAMAFSFAWMTVTDTNSADAMATSIKVERRTLVETYDMGSSGKLQISLLPIIRNEMATAGTYFAPDAVSPLAGSITIRVTAYNGKSVLGMANITVPYIFGASSIATDMAGDRHITYNDAIPESAFSALFDTANGSEFSWDGSAYGYTKHGNKVMASVKLSHMPTALTSYTITSTTCKGYTRGTLANAPLRIHVTKDTRTANIVAVRWIDQFGGENYRAFATGTKGVAGKTSTSFARFAYNRDLVGGVDVGNDTYNSKTLTRTLTFGDDAVPAGQFDWVASLAASSMVEIKVGVIWTRCKVSDSTVAMSSDRHIFNCSFTTTFDSEDTQIW